MFNVNGVGTLNNHQITSNNSYQQPVNELATARGGIGEKWPDANDDVAASDCRRKTQTTHRNRIVGRIHIILLYNQPLDQNTKLWILKKL